jgi:hypothetical protein
VQVSKLVWAFGPKVAALRMLLLALAEHADDEGKAFPGLDLLASEVLRDKETVSRQLARLEREGWLKVQRRTAGVLCSNGLFERRGNTYFLSLDKLRGVTRTASEKTAPTGQREAAAGVPARTAREESRGSIGQRASAVAEMPDSERNGVQEHRSGAVEMARRDDETAEPNRRFERSEPTFRTSRTDVSYVPLLNHQEPPKNHHEKYNQPLPLPQLPQVLKSYADGESESKGKNAGQEQEQKATASAKATATTSSLRAPGVSTESVGEAGLSSGPGFRVGGAVVEFRGRRQVEEELDGLDAAVRDEAIVVLVRCGIPPGTATRRERKAVEAALHMECLRTGKPVADVGRKASNAWLAYVSQSALLYRVVGLRKFLSEGYWLDNGRPWDWNQQALAERQRKLDAGIGAYRSN